MVTEEKLNQVCEILKDEKAFVMIVDGNEVKTKLNLPGQPPYDEVGVLLIRAMLQSTDQITKYLFSTITNDHKIDLPRSL